MFADSGHRLKSLNESQSRIAHGCDWPLYGTSYTWNEVCDSTPAVKLTIDGVELYFPFKPYPMQIQMMSNVIKAMKTV